VRASRAARGYLHGYTGYSEDIRFSLAAVAAAFVVVGASPGIPFRTAKTALSRKDRRGRGRARLYKSFAQINLSNHAEARTMEVAALKGRLSVNYCLPRTFSKTKRMLKVDQLFSIALLSYPCHVAQFRERPERLFLDTIVPPTDRSRRRYHPLFAGN
jgi:hypothetical protein